MTTRAGTFGPTRSSIPAIGALTLFGVGIGVVAVALVRGDAHVAWVVIVPVFYGSSPLLALGALAWIGGVVWFAIGAGAGTGSERPAAGPGEDPPSWDRRGLVLIGPVPILFGPWGPAARWVYRIAFVVGVALVVLAVAVALGGFP